MFFGDSIGKEDALHMMDAAFDMGIKCLDTAEMYPVPKQAATQGRSEKVIGEWLSKRQRSTTAMCVITECCDRRDKVIISTKIAGPSGRITWIRNGADRLGGKDIIEAVDGSLRRLGTDYVDIYHIHWPDRYRYIEY